jgi:methyltransferase-like protein
MKEGYGMKIKEDFMIRHIADEWVVIPMGERLKEFNSLIKLNESGAFIWKILEKGVSKDEIIDALLEEFDADEKKASEDVEAFLRKLEEASILEDI